MADNGTRLCDTAAMAKRKKKTRREELLDELLKEYGGPAGVTGPDGLLSHMTNEPSSFSP